MSTTPKAAGLLGLPDELLHHILWYLDIPEVLAISRTSQHLRALALDPHLHSRRRHESSRTLFRLLPHRPPLASLSPPQASIYLSRTHLAARRLQLSLVSIRLNRSLSRRPGVERLVSANILPRECCRKDRASGQVFLQPGEGGRVAERKRRVEREIVKHGLKVWLERKAREITRRKPRDGSVGVLVWRFSRRLKVEERCCGKRIEVEGEQGKVKGLRKFWESMGQGTQMVARA